MKNADRLDEFLLPSAESLRLMSDNIESPTNEEELLRAVNWRGISEFFNEDSESPAHLAMEMEQASSKRTLKRVH